MLVLHEIVNLNNSNETVMHYRCYKLISISKNKSHNDLRKLCNILQIYSRKKTDSYDFFYYAKLLHCLTLYCLNSFFRSFSRYSLR